MLLLQRNVHTRFFLCARAMKDSQRRNYFLSTDQCEKMQPNTSPCFLLDGKSILPLTDPEEEQKIVIPLKYLPANSVVFCPCYFRRHRSYCFDRRLTDDHVTHTNNNKRPWPKIEDDTERCSCSPTDQRSNNHHASRRVLSAKRRRSTDHHHHHQGMETCEFDNRCR